MKILSLDIGTSLGWAMASVGRIETLVVAGTLILGTDKNLKHSKKLRMDRRLDIRALALALWLEANGSVDWCVFEDVRFASSQAQAHLWGSLRGVIWSWAGRHDVQIDCLDTGKLKLFTTGHGNATKDMMAASAHTRWPQYMRPDMDDNAVDAICLLQWAREKIK